MSPPIQGWLVVGDNDHRSIYLDKERALQAAVAHRGIIKPLVLEEHVRELVAAAFQSGAKRGDSRKE